MSTYEEKIRFLTEHTYGTWRPQKGWKAPLFITKVDGAYFWDHKGNKYLDFTSQLICSNLGLSNKAVSEAIKKQADEMPYISPGFVCEAKYQATKALLEVLPKNLTKIFYSTSGTEGIEAAFKITRQYKAPAYKIISRYRSYHGSTGASIAATGDPRRWFAEPVNKVPGVIYAPDPFCYRCPFGLDPDKCSLQCAEYVDYMIKMEGNVAAVLVEPIVGTNGRIVPPDGYMQRLREITRENDVLLIADEVMSGWFRAGKWFAVNIWGVEPDILVTAKGSTAAFAPLGITATTKEIAEHFEEKFFAHGHTYAAHPLVLAPVPAAIEEYKKLYESGHIDRVGSYLGKRLRELYERHPCVGDVRGVGFFWAVEIVKNRETKKPFNTRKDKAEGKPLMVDKISAELMKRGIYLLGWITHFIVAPPLVVTEEDIDFFMEAFDEALKIADAEVEAPQPYKGYWST